AKRVPLCLWAGATPHARAPGLEFPEDEDDPGNTAVEAACHHGADAKILKRLGPHPSRYDFDELYRWAATPAVVDVLARSELPKNAGPIVSFQLFWLHGPFGRSRPLDTIRRLFEVGMRWERSEGDNISEVRRSLLKMSNYDFVDLMKLFASNGYCSSAILKDIGRTP